MCLVKLAAPMLDGQHQLCVLISPPGATPGAPSGSTWETRSSKTAKQQQQQQHFKRQQQQQQPLQVMNGLSWPSPSSNPLKACQH
jgi:hypothetical protein